MKYILDINSPEKRYTFNLYQAACFEDGSVQADARIIGTDNLSKFIEELGILVEEIILPGEEKPCA